MKNVPSEALALAVIRLKSSADAGGAVAVSSVLNAAAWTYVAATLQTLLTVLYYLMRFGGLARDD